MGACQYQYVYLRGYEWSYELTYGTVLSFLFLAPFAGYLMAREVYLKFFKDIGLFALLEKLRLRRPRKQTSASGHRKSEPTTEAATQTSGPKFKCP